MQRHTQIREEANRLSGIERTQHAGDEMARATPEVGGLDAPVGHVAARAAADEDLRSEVLRTIETDHAQVASRASREDGGCEPGRPRANHDHVSIECRTT